MKTDNKPNNAFHHFSSVSTALTVLVILELSMMFSMFTRTQPHPPLETPLFGMGPFLGACIALTVASLMLGANRTTAGRIVGLIAMLFALIAFGPQKWFDPIFPKIWPALFVAQIAVAVVVWGCFRGIQRPGSSPHDSDHQFKVGA